MKNAPFSALSPELGRRRFLLLGAAAFLLSGCSGMIGPGPAPQLYVLHPALGPIPGATDATWQLAVAQPSAPQSLDTERIALALTPETMDYYAHSAWQDRAPVIVQRALLEGFENSGKIAAVARDTQGIRADYLLQTDLRSFEARYEAPDTAPDVVVDIAAKLLRTSDRNIVAALQTHHTATAAANSVPSIVAAFDTALGAAVEEIVTWVLKAPPSV